MDYAGFIFSKKEYIWLIVTYQIDILNPKADKLLKDLADMQLISITEMSSADPFLTVVNRLRKKASLKSPTLEEITKEVEVVRAKRYAKNKA
jgi:hypothetical protein